MTDRDSIDIDTDPEAQNQDDLRVTELYTAYRVLETLREKAAAADHEYEADTLNAAHCLIQDYEQESMWTTLTLNGASVTLSFDDLVRGTLAEVYTRKGYDVTGLHWQEDSALKIEFEQEPLEES